MFDIGSYLEKFKKFSQSREFLRNSVSESIKEVCGIDIDSKNIEVKNFTAKIKERPIIKSEIFLKKEKILELLKEKTEGKILDVI